MTWVDPGRSTSLGPGDALDDARIEFGPGTLARLPEVVAAVGARAFVVTDAGLRATGIVDRVLAGLAAAGIEHGVVDRIGANPSTATVDDAAADLRAFGPAVVVAVGGGSVLDAAKGVALLAGNPGASAAGADALADAADGWPVVAVPTTSGTGAETNGFGVLEDTCARRKVYLGHSSVRPVAAVLDPELTLGLPGPLIAATGFDALVHGVESLASRGADAVSEAYASRAVALVGRWLPVACTDGADLEARSRLMLGAHLAGRALTISGLGLVHGIAHALTAHLGTPHGVALAAVNEQVMAWSADAASTAYGEVAAAMGAPDAVGAVGAVGGVVEAVGVRRSLRELGATRELLPVLAAAAVADAVTRNAPRTPTTADVEDLLAAVF